MTYWDKERISWSADTRNAKSCCAAELVRHVTISVRAAFLTIFGASPPSVYQIAQCSDCGQLLGCKDKVWRVKND